MRGIIITMAAVLVAIGVGIGIVAGAWSPPSYRADGLTVAAAFPIPAWTAEASVAGVRVREWVRREGTAQVALTIASRGIFRLSQHDRLLLLERLNRSLPGRPLGWVAYAPLAGASACGPSTGRRVIDGHTAKISTVGGVHLPGASSASTACLGNLTMTLHDAVLVATAIGTASEVRSFLDSIKVRRESA